MKKLLLTATITLACVAAFAQGKVKFVNDSLHLVYYTTDTTKLVQSDTALAGTAALSTQGLTVELWAGTSATTLAVATSASISAAPGTWLPIQLTIPGVAGGASGFFDVRVYTANAGSYSAASTGNNLYYGDSGVFTTVTGASINYNSIVLATSPSLSTWAAGTQDVTGSVTGAKGAIALQANVPEPTSLALLGLGAAGMMIFRRRK